MTMFQVLPKMVGAEELLRLIAFTELVGVGEMSDAIVPVRLWFVCELLPTVPTNVHGSQGLYWWRTLVGGLRSDAGGRMKGAFIVAR